MLDRGLDPVGTDAPADTSERTMKQLARFVAVGALNTLLGYAVIFACMYLVRLSPEVSNVAGYAVGLAASYALNRSFTFGSDHPVSHEAPKFLVAFLAAYTLNFIVLLILVRAAGLHAGVSQVLAGVVYVGAFYLLSKRFVFATR
jgi:putative flippase GtrA